MAFPGQAPPATIRRTRERRGDVIKTPRLLLRNWKDSDVGVFVEMNRDPIVMRHFPSVLDRRASERLAKRIRGDIEQRGWGWWAVEHEGSFIGFTGLAPVRFAAHFTPAVEIAWRLVAGAWGQGFATEAAGAALGVGFTEVGLEEIISMTTPANTRSRAVMERLGMTRDPAEDFDHPLLPAGDEHRRHVLYRLSRDRWSSMGIDTKGPGG